jgi:tRNA(Arg) A34 adenosine deaminase TadA
MAREGINQEYFNPNDFIPYPYTAYIYTLSSFISGKDKSFLAAASKLAQTSDNRFKMACIVVRAGSVLGADINVTKVSPSTPPNRFSTHAEIGAMKACSDPTDATLYISRLKLDGTTAMARPCSWCMQFIQSNSIYRVVYTTDFDYPESFYISSVEWNYNVLKA